jgi:hypothetical protein
MGLSQTGRDLVRAEQYSTLALSHAPPLFRSRALLSLATVAGLQGDNSTQRGIFAKLCEATDIYSRFEAIRGQAIALSKAGGHQEGLKILSSLLAPARHLKGSLVSFKWAHSMAVELLASKNLEAAKYYSLLALQSPLAKFYPEVEETAGGVAQSLRKPSRPYVVQPCNAFWKVIHHDFISTAKRIAEQGQRHDQIAEIKAMLAGFNPAQVADVHYVCVKVKDGVALKAD